MTTAQEVIDHFAVSAGGRRLLDQWRRDPHKAAVVPDVLAHESRVVEAASLAEVADVCRRTEHALGEVKRTDAMSVSAVRDWHPPHPTMFVLHSITEEAGRIPTWE
ncbi:hypothetical protein [Geodermatophilus saharensis]|uniref:hypothetical protein n=1 Tax=Geodermatophilus saharensis TaxID=1137994 RepID=UPI000B76EAEC|nr:hypothetical protein [Geodermatophilus saharensis]